MKPTQIEALRSVAAEKKGIPAKGLHWRLRELFLKQGYVRTEERRVVKGEDPVTFVVATADGKKALKAAEKACCKKVKA